MIRLDIRSNRKAGDRRFDALAAGRSMGIQRHIFSFLGLAVYYDKTFGRGRP